MSIPSKQTAAVTGTDSLVIKEVPVPSIKPNEVLVKIEAAAINPTDWKHLFYGLYGAPGAITGCDLAGVAVKIGSEVTNISVGDAGVGFVHGSNKAGPHNGAFAQYAIVKSHLFFKLNSLNRSESDNIPRGIPTTFEGASSLGVSLVTILISLFHNMGGSFGLSKTKAEESEKYLLIWGGASSTGQIAVQFGKLIGWKIITTASKKNHAELKELGADFVVDYRDPDVVNQIKAIGGEDIVYALDSISLANTIQATHDSVSSTKPVIFDNLLGFKSDDIKNLKPNVKVTQTLAYFSSGDPFYSMGGPGLVSNPEISEFVRRAQPVVAEAVNKGLIQHIPIKVLPNGLNSLNEGYLLSKENKVSNEKLVIRPYDTKQ